MATYTLNVHVDDNQLEFLKKNNFSLCLAREANKLYTVVWTDSVKYIQENEFQWSEEYQIFGSNNFEVGSLVKNHTNIQNISFNESCTLDTAGVMQAAQSSGVTPGTFHVINDYGPICLAVNCKIGDAFQTIFVSPNQAGAGTANFMPINKVKVWFEQSITTGTMIYDVKSDNIEVDFTERIEARVGYVGSEPGKGKWIEMPGKGK